MTQIVDSFFQNLLGSHSGWASAPLKVAFYQQQLPSATPSYTSVGESSGSGYTPGGFAVTPTWANVGSTRNFSLNLAQLIAQGTFYVACALIYRSDTGEALAVLPLGGQNVAGQLSITFPTPVFNLSI